MESHNYCLIKKNKIYEDLYEILEDEELIMDNQNHKEEIKYKIKKLTTSYFGNIVSISNTFSTSNDNLEDLMVEIINNEEDENMQGNTLLMFADHESMYEIVFMEQIGIEKSDNELNQLASISNIELAPIYGNVAIVKSSYQNGKLTNKLITEQDITKLIINNFYHLGVMINPDGSTLELEFTGDNPNITIGGNFIQVIPFQMFGLTLVGYKEVGTEINHIASKLYGSEIKGRFYVSTLCPITNKRFWGINSEMLKGLIKLLEYSEGTIEERAIIEKLNNELSDDKLKNPFFLIKKYCV
jgi:hypothetical protein